MSTDDYVIDIDGQSIETSGIADSAGVVKSGSRRTSISSEQSINSDPQLSYNYDSGNFSYSFNSSDSVRPNSFSSEDEQFIDSLTNIFNQGGGDLPDNIKQLCKELRDKDQSLSASLNEIKRLKSQCERLIKSEQWYKNELKTQKRTKLELLEKLYLNKREYIQENQKLKADCSRLYALCDDIERKTLHEKDSLVKQLYELQKLFHSSKFSDENSALKLSVEDVEFNLQRQKCISSEQESLIELLRKQKQSLLTDLSNLNSEKDAKVASLENNTFTLEHENRKITKKCVSLMQENNNLEICCRQKEELLADTQSTLKNNEIQLKQLSENFEKQSKDLKICNIEISRLNSVIASLRQNPHENNIEINFSNTSKSNSTADPNALRLQQYFGDANENVLNIQPDLLPRENIDSSLVENFKIEISNKNCEIENLKSSNSRQKDKMFRLQSELSRFNGLLENYETNQQLIHEYQEDIEDKVSEIQNLQSIQKIQSDEIEKLQTEIDQYRNLEDDLLVTREHFERNRSDLASKISEIDNLKLLCNSQSNEIQILHIELKNSKELQTDFDKNLIDLENKNIEIQTLNIQNQDYNNRISILQDELLQYQKLRENFDKYVNILQSNNEELEAKNSELNSLKSVVESQVLQITQLNSELIKSRQLLANFDNIQTKVEGLETDTVELANLKILFKNQTETISILNDEKSKLQETVENSEHLLEKKNNELENKSQELEKLSTLISQLNVKLKEFNSCEQEMHIKQENLEKLLLSKNSENETQNKEIEKLSTEILENQKDMLKFKSKLIEYENLLHLKNEQLETKNYELENIFDEKNENARLQEYIKELNIKILNQNKELNLFMDEKQIWNKSEIEFKNKCLEIDNKDEVIENLKNIINKKNEEILKLTEEYLQLSCKKVPVSYKKTILDDKLLTLMPSDNFITQKQESDQPLIRIFQNTANFPFIEEINENPKETKSQEEENLQILEKKIRSQILIIDNLKLCQEQYQIELQKHKKLVENYEREKIESNQKINKFRESSLSDCNKCDLIMKEKEDLLIKCNQLRETSQKVPETCDNECQVETDIIKEMKMLEIMNKVIETEHRRKIERYEIHIRTLLNNVKTYKKNFKNALKKYKFIKENEIQPEKISLDCKNNIVDEFITQFNEKDNFHVENFKECNPNDNDRSCVNNFNPTCPINDFEKTLQMGMNSFKKSGNLDELNFKLEETVQTIKILKQKLEFAQQQLSEKDDYKCLSQELQNNLINLMDDYKKVFKPFEFYQSKSLKSNEIYDLIDKSDKFVPTLYNLSNSVEGLKDDLKLLRIYTAGGNNRGQSVSLLDELKAVDACSFS